LIIPCDEGKFKGEHPVDSCRRRERGGGEERKKESTALYIIMVKGTEFTDISLLSQEGGRKKERKCAVWLG